MKKHEEPQKITALGVVIFSFVSILIGAAILLGSSTIVSILVLKTSLSESFMMIGSVIGSGAGLITAAAMLTTKTKMKGIFASSIIALFAIGIKILGNYWLNLGGYFTLNGLIGFLFVLIFSLIGGVIGSCLKR